jgi:hypothetical protein
VVVTEWIGDGIVNIAFVYVIEVECWLCSGEFIELFCEVCSMLVKVGVTLADVRVELWRGDLSIWNQ